jgi:hypothetical protein
VNEPEARRRPRAARLRALFFDTSWDTFFRFVLTASLLLELVVAYRSQGFYDCDEHFQILEFMGLKLGTALPSDLPWEFRAEMRSWFQPALYYPFAKLFFALGGQEPFRLAWLLRTLSALVSWSALYVFSRCLPRFLPDGAVRRWTLVSLHFFYLVPTLGVRTGSENFSQAFLLFGIGALIEPGRLGTSLYPDALEASRARDGARLSGLTPSLWLAGLAFGLAYLARFQAAALVAGCCVWFWVFGPRRRAFLLGVGGGLALAFALGVVLDRWGYGHWVYSPWQYVRANLLEGKAASFGRSPVWGFVTLFATKLWPPFGLLWFSVFVLAAWQLPRHLLTWTVLPFVLLHHAIAHKEPRFLFPTLALSTVLGGLLVARFLAGRTVSERLLGWASVLGGALLVMDALGIGLYGLMPMNQRWTLLDELDRLSPDGYTVFMANGYAAISTCGVHPGFYWGKRHWQPYERGAPLVARDERGLAAFYGWAGTPRSVLENPFAPQCVEVEPKFWISSPLARAAWATAPLAAVARELTSYVVYRCPGTNVSSAGDAEPGHPGKSN